MNANDQLNVVALGYIVRCPLAGMAWHYLQYVAGLASMGHRVCFVEDSGDDPWACYDPLRGTSGTDPSYGLKFTKHAFDHLELGNCWAYHDASSDTWHGPRSNDILEVCSRADVLINISGSNLLRPWLREIPHRIYIDTDPAFTQVRNRADASRRTLTQQHSSFFSFGENTSDPRCTIPDDGFSWQPTRQPVVSDLWPLTDGPEGGPFTTVMQWDNSIQNAPIMHGGHRFGRKSDSFETYARLPQQSPASFELALGGDTAPRDRLRKLGWKLRDPLCVTRDLDCYREYIRSSKAEFGVAKAAYVSTRSGWFSERSAGYLASGRPTVIQDTGFTDWLAVDGGVVAFSNLDEALAGVHDVNRRYAWHCRQARQVIHDYFDATQVLNSLLSRAAAVG